MVSATVKADGSLASISVRHANEECGSEMVASGIDAVPASYVYSYWCGATLASLHAQEGGACLEVVNGDTSGANVIGRKVVA